MMSKHVLPSTLFAILFLFLAASKVYAVPTTLSFQTKIYKPDGSPLEASAVNFRFTTVDSTGTCILYVEDFSNINMSTSAGMAIFNLGAGLRVFPAAVYIYTDIYNNLQSSFPCQGGGTFSPAPAGTDRRKIIAQFID